MANIEKERETLEKILEKAEKQKAKIKEIENKENDKKRKLQTKGKIILGALISEDAKHNPDKFQPLLKRLTENLKPKDKEAVLAILEGVNLND